jgi:hypothetical protein
VARIAAQSHHGVDEGIDASVEIDQEKVHRCLRVGADERVEAFTWRFLTSRYDESPPVRFLRMGGGRWEKQGAKGSRNAGRSSC